MLSWDILALINELDYMLSWFELHNAISLL